MRKILALFIALIAVPATASAQTVPVAIPVQGILTDAQEAPVNGNVAMTFTIYDSANSSVFAETLSVDVENGFYSVRLGETGAGLTASTFRTGAAVQLGIKVGGDAEMSPRLDFGSVPYAIMAEFAADAAHAVNADTATFATDAQSAVNATNAVNAQNAQTAANATNAQNAANATNATNAQNAANAANVSDGVITTAKLSDNAVTQAKLAGATQVYRVTSITCEQEPGTLMTSSTCRAWQFNVDQCTNACSGQRIRDCAGNCGCTPLTFCLVGQPCPPNRGPACPNTPAGYIVGP